MPVYPSAIFHARETENLPGLVYDPDDKKNFFSEDFQNLGAEITSIEETLGTDPQGSFPDVASFLQALFDQSSLPILSNSPLKNPIIVPAFASSLISGTTDIYTVPTGKKALLLGGQIRNTTGSSVQYYLQLKHLGNYYRLGTNTSATANSTSSSSLYFLFEAGESISIGTTATGLNAFYSVIEIDDDSLISRSTIFSGISGDNILLTSPTGKGAILLSTGEAIRSQSGTLSFLSGSGSSSTMQIHIVPPAGSPSTATLLNSFSLGAGLNSSQNLHPYIPSDYSLVVSSTQPNILISCIYVLL